MYYISWGCFYATGSSPYGPFTYTGVMVDESLIAPDFRIGSNTSEPWYARDDFHDRHGSFWTHGGQWYWSANDRSHSSDTADPSKYRDTVLAYLHFFNNGTMAPVVINGTGVSTYSLEATDGRVEAENFFEATGGLTVEESDVEDVVDVMTHGAMARRGSWFRVGGISEGTGMLVYPAVEVPSRGLFSVGLVVKGASPGLWAVLRLGETGVAKCDLGLAAPGAEAVESAGVRTVSCDFQETYRGGGMSTGALGGLRLPLEPVFRLEVQFQRDGPKTTDGLGGGSEVSLDRIQFY